MRVLFIYLIISTTTEFAAIGLPRLYEIYYNVIQLTFTCLEFLLLSFMYYLEFTSKQTKGALLFLALIYLALTMAVLSTGYSQANGLLSAIESFTMIGFSIAFFYKVYSEMNIPKLKEYSFIAINSAVLIYFSAAFVLFLFAEYLDHCPKKIFQILWGFHDIGNIVYNSFLAIGIWRQKK